MKKIVAVYIIIALPFFLLCGRSYGQVQQIIAGVDSLNKKMPVEKLYLQTDKQYYLLGDTIWYKAYLLSADLYVTQKSKLLYIEMVTDSGAVAKRQLLPVENGVSWGNIILDSSDFLAGNYTLRGYTNWMRNFGEGSFFNKTIQLYKPSQQDWLISYKTSVNKETVQGRLQLKNMNGKPLPNRTVELSIKNGRKTILQNNAKTDIEGALGMDFKLPEKANQLTLQIKDTKVGEVSKTFNVPILLQRPDSLDIQFLTEGGNLVGGLKSLVAFKAIGENGKAVDVSGKVYNSKDEEVAAFKSGHLGMGSFFLQPQLNETYTAKLTQPYNDDRKFILPAVKTEGTVLNIQNVVEDDSLTLNIMATNNLRNNFPFYMVCLSRNAVCYIARVKVKENGTMLRVPKNALPTGVARFSLLNEALLPLNERTIYVDNKRLLDISLNTNKQMFGQRDSIAVNIHVTDSEGKPVQSSLSLSVIDNGQIRPDTTTSICTYFLLISDIQGEIENPAYYFDRNNSNASKDLDNLLLTQGWTGYDWQKVYDIHAVVPQYAPELDYNVSGKVTNFFNRPVPGTGVSLLSKRPFLVMDTLTNNTGQFVFRNVNPIDTAIFFIQARNKNGKSANVGITVDEFKPPFFPTNYKRQLPWYVNADSDKTDYIKTAVVVKEDKLISMAGEHQLQNVIVKGKRSVPGSFNLNGPGEADLLIDQMELEKMGKMTLGELLKKRIDHFNIGEFPTWDNNKHRPIKFLDPRRKTAYLIGEKQMRLVIDGYDVDLTFQASDINSKTERFFYIKSYLDYYTAEDIKGIELIYSAKYNNVYNSKVLSFEEQRDVLHIYNDFAYIEITTRGGKGPFLKTTPGIYLYKPLPFSLPKKFYSPRYVSGETKLTKDLRSTIYWEPNIVTGTDGNATVSFFSSDRGGTYTITLEGSNLLGSVGTKRGIITIIEGK